MRAGDGRLRGRQGSQEVPGICVSGPGGSAGLGIPPRHLLLSSSARSSPRRRTAQTARQGITSRSGIQVRNVVSAIARGRSSWPQLRRHVAEPAHDGEPSHPSRLRGAPFGRSRTAVAPRHGHVGLRWLTERNKGNYGMHQGQSVARLLLTSPAAALDSRSNEMSQLRCAVPRQLGAPPYAAK